MCFPSAPKARFSLKKMISSWIRDMYENEGELPTQNRYITTLCFVGIEGELATGIKSIQVRKIHVARTTARSTVLSRKSESGTRDAPGIKYSRGNTWCSSTSCEGQKAGQNVVQQHVAARGRTWYEMYPPPRGGYITLLPSVLEWVLESLNRERTPGISKR